MTILIYIFSSAAILLAIVIYVLTHLIDEARKGLVKNVPRILLGGFFTGCVGAAILVVVFSRYYRFFLSDPYSSVGGTGCAPGFAALGINLTTAGLGIIGFLLGFLLGVAYLKRWTKILIVVPQKIARINIPWKKILIIVVLIIVGVIGYRLCYLYIYRSPFWEQRPAPPKELPVAPPIIEEPIIEEETADWHIYQNEEYGFEIKFPKDWIIEKTIIADPEAARPVESVFGLHPKDKVYYHTVGGYTKGTINPISIEIWKSMEDYQKMWGGVAGAKKVLISDNISALYGRNELGEIFYIFENPNNNIGVTLRSEIDMISYQLKPSEIEELKKIFNQILSTFKFTPLEIYE